MSKKFDFGEKYKGLMISKNTNNKENHLREIWTNKPDFDINIPKLANNEDLHRFGQTGDKRIHLISNFSGTLKETEKFYKRQRNFDYRLKDQIIDFNINRFQYLEKALELMIEKLEKPKKKFRFCIYKDVHLPMNYSNDHSPGRMARCTVKFSLNLSI